MNENAPRSELAKPIGSQSLGDGAGRVAVNNGVDTLSLQIGAGERLIQNRSVASRLGKEQALPLQAGRQDVECLLMQRRRSPKPRRQR